MTNVAIVASTQDLIHCLGLCRYDEHVIRWRWHWFMKGVELRRGQIPTSVAVEPQP